MPGDTIYGQFGPSGSWRHSYHWALFQDNPGQTPAIWRVHYPSGATVRFAYMTVAAPNASSPTPPADPYMRSVSPGVSDRLENPSGSQSFILHLSDGGRVSFQPGNGGTQQVQWIADPYNQYTTFSYYTGGTGAGLIQYITEPAGRWLQLSYAVEGSNTVVAGVSASNGQSVTYNYTVQGTAPNTTTFLTGVTYNNDPNPATGSACQASYGYQPDNTGAGLRPLLGGCDDPHFPGPLPKISYSYVQGSSVLYGQIQAEIDLATNTTISSYSQSNLTETRGDGPTSVYTFNTYLISQQQDYDGGQSSFGYDANSYLSSFTNCNGHAETVTCEPYAGKPLTVSRTDTNGQLLTTTYNYGSTNAVPYPTNPYWVKSITDPRGQKTAFTHNSNNQVTKISYPDGTYETFSYNSFGQVTNHLKTDGSSYTALYDGSGNLYKSTDSFNSPSNNYTYYYYDSLDRLSQVTDFNGHNTWYTYNGRHSLTQLKHDDGTHVDYAYDVYGNQTSMSDELQHVTVIAYDNHRRPTSVQVPVNAGNTTTRTTTFTYERGSDTTGNAHTKRGFGTATLPSGKQVKRIYTGNGHLHSITKGYGNSDATTDTYSYDGMGHVATVVDANNITQASYAYDVLERKSTLTDANGHVTTWNYYPAGSGAYAGWRQSMVAPGPAMGSTATTSYTNYDVMGRLVVTVDPSGNGVGRSYDSNGRLVALGDANGTYSFGYDALSRQNSLSFPDGTTQTKVYDPVGNLSTYKNRAGSTKTTQYDDRNRKTSASWNDNSAPSLAWGYDAASRLTEVDNTWVALHFTYDDSGLPLSERNTNYLASSCVNTTGYTYDVDGNVTGLSYPNGDVPGYRYDDQNRCVGMTSGSTYWNHLYFQGERVSGRVLVNGLSTQYYYQSNDRVSEVWHHVGGNDPGASTFPGSNVSDRVYGYAPDGQMTWSVNEPDGGASGSALENGEGENYQYNSNGSLNDFSLLYSNTAQNANSQGDSTANPSNFNAASGDAGAGSYVSSYVYDTAGNRTKATQMGSAATSYKADAEDRYSGGGWGYDANGNATNAPTGWTYVYDAEGEMSSATRTNDGFTIQFEYDGLGRLIYQNYGSPGQIFCYAGRQRIEERSLTNQSLYRYFYDAPGRDTIVFRFDTSTGAYLFYQYDALGNTTHVSDIGGNIVEQYLYDAYGTPYVYNKAGTYLGQTSTVDNRYLFHGASAYEWLPLAGLYYCRARMYLPIHGRFLQPDPSGFKGGDVNLYRYCANDPVDGDDSTGLTTTIGYYPNQTLPFVGHTSIGTSSDSLLSAYGAGTLWSYGATSNIPVLIGAGHGEVGPDDDDSSDHITLNTTPAQEQAINSYVQSVITSGGGPYSLYPPDPVPAGTYPPFMMEYLNADMNCATFVWRALQAAGIKVPYSVNPRTLFANIKRALANMQVKPTPKSNPSPEPATPSASAGQLPSANDFIYDPLPEGTVTLHDPGDPNNVSNSGGGGGNGGGGGVSSVLHDEVPDEAE